MSFTLKLIVLGIRTGVNSPSIKSRSINLIEEHPPFVGRSDSNVSGGHPETIIEIPLQIGCQPDTLLELDIVTVHPENDRT